MISKIKYISLLAIAFALLWFSFREVHWDDFVIGLKSANFYLIAISMVVGVFAFWIRALRWRLILEPLGYKVTNGDCWHGVTIGYITNFAIPRAGEIARCSVITKRAKIPIEKVGGTVVLERSVDLVSLILISFLVVILNRKRFGSFFIDNIYSGIESKFEFFILLYIFIAFIIVAITSLFIYKYKKESIVVKKISGLINGITQGVTAGFSMNNKGLFFLYTALLWVCYWLMSYTTILAFPAIINLSVVDAMFLMIVGGFGWVIPVQGGIGAYHLIISLALSSVYNIEQTTGVVFATISHESQAITMIVFGAISLLITYLFKSRKS